jgi:excisionase family DNA binding protein
MSPLLGSRDVAEMLGMSREQVWRLWSSGRLPGYRFDRHIRFARADLERFLADHYHERSAPLPSRPAREPRARGRAEYHRI